MRVRYKPAFGITFVVLGAVCAVLGTWLLLLGEIGGAVLVGPLCLALGIAHLVRPYFWVQPGVVEVAALIGPMKRRFPFRRLEAEGSRLIVVRDDNSRKKLPVTRWMARSDDWAAVLDGIRPVQSLPN